MPATAGAAAGRAPGSSGSRSPPPSSAGRWSVRPSSSQPRVSCTSGSPRSRASAWRSTSNSSARSSERKLLRFFTSTLVPKAVEPAGRTLTLPSIRMLPASMSAFAGADGAQQLAQRLAVGARLRRRAQVRLGDDLHQRHAGAVEVDDAVAAPGVLHPRRVLLEVGAGDPDRRPRRPRSGPARPAGRSTVSGSAYWLIW